jgi:hypothetical protein
VLRCFLGCCPGCPTSEGAPASHHEIHLRVKRPAAPRGTHAAQKKPLTAVPQPIKESGIKWVGMQYQVDGTRLLLLLALLASGMFVATRLVQPSPPSSPTALAPRRIAIRGMLAMTLLGLASGLVGGLAEDASGETPYVSALHGIYSLCWAPVFVTSRLEQALSGSGASSRLARDLLGPLGPVLIPNCLVCRLSRGGPRARALASRVAAHWRAGGSPGAHTRRPRCFAVAVLRRRGVARHPGCSDLHHIELLSESGRNVIWNILTRRCEP